MTVIAWDSKEMVSDSQCTYETGKRSYNEKKLFRLKSGAVLGTAGDADWRDILNLLDSAEHGYDLPSRHDLSVLRTHFHGLIWLPDRSIWEISIEQDEEERHVWYASVTEVKEKKAAVGCGADNAMGVLDNGGSARDAVKAAIKRDVFCGGPLQCMTLEVPKPIKENKKSHKKIKKVINTDDLVSVIE